ncbi:unnamed protein product [Calypogeia fissa]
MNPSTSCRDQKWWKTPWLIEAKGVKMGGFCDVNINALYARDPDSCLDEEGIDERIDGCENPIAGGSQSIDPDQSEVSDLDIASANVQETMSTMYN